MPKIIIRLPNQQDQRFSIEKNEVLIGRGDECDLVLPGQALKRREAEGAGAEVDQPQGHLSPRAP